MRRTQPNLSKFLITIQWNSKYFLDKKIDNDDDTDNDVYETIEFSDSSSNVYTEPIRDYGNLRKVNIKTSPRSHSTNRKPPSGMKKSTGSRNLHKFKAMQNVSEATNDENEPNVELRMKPYETTEVSSRNAITNPTNSLISVGLHFISICNLTPNNLLTFSRIIFSILGCRSAIYSNRKFGLLYPTTRCFGYLNQFRMFKFKTKK